MCMRKARLALQTPPSVKSRLGYRRLTELNILIGHSLAFQNANEDLPVCRCPIIKTRRRLGYEKPYGVVCGQKVTTRPNSARMFGSASRRLTYRGRRSKAVNKPPTVNGVLNDADDETSRSLMMVKRGRCSGRARATILQNDVEVGTEPSARQYSVKRMTGENVKEWNDMLSLASRSERAWWDLTQTSGPLTRRYMLGMGVL